MLALRLLDFQNHPVETKVIQPTMVLRMVPKSVVDDALRPTGRVAATRALESAALAAYRASLHAPL